MNSVEWNPKYNLLAYAGDDKNKYMTDEGTVAAAIHSLVWSSHAVLLAAIRDIRASLGTPISEGISIFSREISSFFYGKIEIP
jgi:hypothetical protein